MLKSLKFVLLSSCIVSSLNALPPPDDEMEVNKSSTLTLNKDKDVTSLAAPVNPFISADIFGFDYLRNWHLLTQEEKEAWEKESTEHLRAALSVKEDNQEKDRLLKEGAGKGFHTSMLLLGRLNQDNKNLNEAFSWYALSLWTQLIRGASLEGIQKTPFNSWKNLSEIIELPNSSPSQKNYFEFLKTTLPCLASPLMQAKTFKDRASILCAFLGKSHALEPLFDAKISAFTFNVTQWINPELLRILGNNFSSKNKTQEAAYCYEAVAKRYRKSQTPEALCDLGVLIYDGHINTDLEGKAIPKGKKYEVAANLFRKSKTPKTLHNLGFLIQEGHINTDLEGRPIPEGKKYEVAANLFRKSKTPDALRDLGFLIANRHINTDLKGRSIPEWKKYEVAADLYRQSKTPFALGNLGVLISKGRINTNLEGKPIPERKKYEVAANLYRQSNIPETLNNLGALIEEGHINTDLKGRLISKGKKYEVAADLYRQSKIPEALFSLGFLIQEGHINTDLEGRPIPEGKKYEVAADLYRKSKIPNALFSLGFIIAEGHINTDLKGNPISEGEKNEVAADLYRQSNIPDALCNLGFLIQEGHINTDLKGSPISEGEKNEVAADLYRQSKIPDALCNLGFLIQEGHINTDLDGKLIPERKKNGAAANLYSQSKTPEARFYLALLEFNSSGDQHFKDIKKAMDLFLEASLAGHKKSHEFYLFLKDKIQKEEKKLEITSDNVAQAEPLEQAPVEEENPHEKQTNSIPNKVDAENMPKPSHSEEKLPHEQDEDSLSSDSSDEEEQWLKAAKEERTQRKLQRQRELKDKVKKVLNRKATQEEISSLYKNRAVSVEMKIKKKPFTVVWSKDARKDYKTLTSDCVKRIHQLIEDIKIDGRRGKPETLVSNDSSRKVESRRITKGDRIVYERKSGGIEILSCKGHYGD